MLGEKLLGNKMRGGGGLLRVSTIFSLLLDSSLSQLFILPPFGLLSPPSSSVLTEPTEVISLFTSYASVHISADICLLTFFAAPPGIRQEWSLSSPQNQLFPNPGLNESLTKTFLILVVTFSHLQTCKLGHFFISRFLGNEIFPFK